ncbi:MAG: hypothetical protein PHC45_00210 [Clostridiaceae bacterium]|nr:hypothetical protein [Clostridiaceae bacterium]
MNQQLPMLKQTVEEEITDLSEGLHNYLAYLGLPTENVLIEPEERRVVINNLPSIIDRVQPEFKENAVYISKFIAACGIGLFDAALNMLWNETVANLRRKVAQFDIDYFLNSVVTDSKRRASIRTEDDLKKLDEWELIKGCKDTGIISEIGFKHLDYIRDMRNHASAAHPNHNDIDGLQLSSWLQTCIKEVLAKEPEGPVLEVKRLLNNLRCNVLSQNDVAPIESNIQKLPIDLVDSTIRAVFGMYTQPDTDSTVRQNLRYISPSLWSSCSKQSKHEAGLKYAVFSANAEVDRKRLAHEFLSSVDGLSFLPHEQRAIDMNQILDGLFAAHNGWNNFYNEPPHARMLISYVPGNGDVPEAVLEKYVKVLVLCRIGNGFGISSGAYDYYDELVNRFSDKHFLVFLKLLWDSDVLSRLQFSSCANNYKHLADGFYQKTANIKLKTGLEAISKAQNAALLNANTKTKFIDLINSISV